MENWNEMRTAAVVARIGQVSGAADILGVHRATVHRHIESLEASLGAKLFIRHPKGLTPTDLGLEVLRVADATDDQFATLRRRALAQSGGLTGNISITAVNVVMSELHEALPRFLAQHPKIKVSLISSRSVLKLEYGEAHIAIRMGKRPDAPDNVVLPFRQHRMGLYASRSYHEQFGSPKQKADYRNHRFIGPNKPTPRIAILNWMLTNVPEEAIAIRTDDPIVAHDAVLAGLGIGILPQHVARNYDEMVEVMKPRAEWVIGSWIVTHVDLHRSDKVQACLEHLRATG